jgi:hypothetical protein
MKSARSMPLAAASVNKSFRYAASGTAVWLNVRRHCGQYLVITMINLNHNDGAQRSVFGISLLVLLLASLAPISFVVAQSPTKYLWRIEVDNAIPDNKLPENVRSAFDDDDDRALNSVSIDLNGDGFKEKLIPNEFLRGTGGCPWVVFDTKRKRVVGKIDAMVIFVQERKQSGYVVLECYWRNGGDSGSVTTYAFNGREYVKLASLDLQDEQIDKYFDERKSVLIAR